LIHELEARELFPCELNVELPTQVRETFLKLLRPGLDFQGAFKDVVRKRLRGEENKGESLGE